LFFKPYIKFNFKLRPLIKYIKRINTIAKNKNMDVETLSIHYPLKKDYIDKIIFGVHDINQLSKNIQAILKDIEVPNNKIEKINVIEEELLKPFNWN
jgi:aryl-alcohol dehydrogenase-like predicted oxidoreductase